MKKLTNPLTITFAAILLTVCLAGRAPPQRPPGPADLPPGIVLMWSGASEDIPTGWIPCDGSGGTPDLRDKFIVGTGDSYAVGDIGGQASVDTQHSHGPGSYSASASTSSTYGADTDIHVTTLYHRHTHSIIGTSAIAGNLKQENRPPYFALVYLCRLREEAD